MTNDLIQIEVDYGDPNGPLIFWETQYCTIGKIISLIQQQLPKLDFNDKVLIVEDKVARSNWTLRYLLESFSLPHTDRIHFSMRQQSPGDEAYSIGEVLKELQLEEDDLKKIVHEKDLGVFYDGDIKFKKEKVERVKEDQMNLPTMIMHNAPKPSSLSSMSQVAQPEIIVPEPLNLQQPAVVTPKPTPTRSVSSLRLEIDAGSAKGPLIMHKPPQLLVKELCQSIQTKYPRLSDSFLQLRVKGQVVQDEWTLEQIMQKFNLTGTTIPFQLKIYQYPPPKTTLTRPKATDAVVEVSYAPDQPPLILHQHQYDTIAKVVEKVKQTVPALRNKHFHIIVGNEQAQLTWTLRYLVESFKSCKINKIPLRVAMPEQVRPVVAPEPDAPATALDRLNIYFKFNAQNFLRLNATYSELFFDNFASAEKMAPESTVQLDSERQVLTGPGIYIARQPLTTVCRFAKAIWEVQGGDIVTCTVSTNDGVNRTELRGCDQESSLVGGVGTQLYVELKLGPAVQCYYLVVILKA